MNRLLWSADQPPPNPDALPPLRREPGGPARVLFFNGSELGFSTSAKAFETVCATRSDIDAVHVRVPIKGLLRLAGAPASERWQPWALGTTRLALANGVVMMRLLRTALPLERFDVVHCMTQQRGWPIAKLGGRVGTKFAVNLDATIPGWCREFGWPRSPLNLDARVESKILTRADMVVCWTRWAADSAVRDCGVDPGRITINKSCALVDPDAPFRRHDEIPPRGAPGGGPVRIVFVGNDWERKGGHRLIRWHQERWKDIAQVHVCSRTAPQDHSLKNVVWHGPTARDKLMNEVLPSADLLVMPTRIDTFLIAAQEAQGAGLPVVTSRIAGLPEVVRHERTGFLCTHDDDDAFIAAIETLLTDHALRRRMGVAAREFARLHLSADGWHNHLFDQLIALADGRPIRYAPEGIDIRRSDREPASPRTELESLAAGGSAT
jgi:glycosyltransferase involved in cell wall biosynthesis